ncbi:MAG: hypothetical protein AB1521_07905 [Bacteroidota bacterium]
MARIKIEQVIDRLDFDLKNALEAAVKEVIPNAQFDKSTLFRAFVRAVSRKCSVWVTVPDNYVEKASSSD